MTRFNVADELDSFVVKEKFTVKSPKITGSSTQLIIPMSQPLNQEKSSKASRSSKISSNSVPSYSKMITAQSLSLSKSVSSQKGKISGFPTSISSIKISSSSNKSNSSPFSPKSSSIPPSYPTSPSPYSSPFPSLPRKPLYPSLSLGGGFGGPKGNGLGSEKWFQKKHKIKTWDKMLKTFGVNVGRDNVKSLNRLDKRLSKLDRYDRKVGRKRKR